MSRLRLFGFLFAFGLILISAVTGVAWLRASAEPALRGRVLEPQPAPEVVLTGAGGREVRLSAFSGKVVLLYFGYTFCPDVCPTTLTELRKAFQELGPRADAARVIMVSVDPERDTPDRIDEYVKRFDRRFLGLSGTPEQVAAAAAAFDIYYTRERGSAASGYLVTHTASVLLIDPDGQIRLSYAYGTPPADIAADIRALAAP